MKNNKMIFAVVGISIAIAIILVIFLLIVPTRCSKQESAATETETTIAKETQQETVPRESKEETAATIAKETKTTTATETTTAPKEAPTIKLEIYEGPTYSPADNVCYYRIKAIITGNPYPDVAFSKDDSGGVWGADRVQINIHAGESYNLIAIAKSSGIVATDSILLSWGCEESAPGTTIPSDSTDTIPTPATYNVIIHPFDVGYIVPPTGVNNDSAIIGDSISNANVRGFFALDLSSLSGKNIINAELELKTSKFWGDPSFKGEIHIIYDSYLPLNAGDYDDIPWLATTYTFANNTEPINIQGDSMKENIKWFLDRSISTMSFVILYENNDSNSNFQIDGREFTKGSISLKVTYTE